MIEEHTVSFKQTWGIRLRDAIALHVHSQTGRLLYPVLGLK